MVSLMSLYLSGNNWKPEVTLCPSWSCPVVYLAQFLKQFNPKNILEEKKSQCKYKCEILTKFPHIPCLFFHCSKPIIRLGSVSMQEVEVLEFQCHCSLRIIKLQSTLLLLRISIHQFPCLFMMPAKVTVAYAHYRPSLQLSLEYQMNEISLLTKS